MASIKIAWKKHTNDESQLTSQKQETQSKRKKVQFHSHSSNSKNQTNANIDDNHVNKTVSIPKPILKNSYFSSNSSNTSTDEISIIYDKALCSGRAAVVTFIIIIFMIIIAVFSASIVFGVVKSNQNQTAIVTSDQNSFSTVSTLVLTSSISIGSQSGAPCTSYTTINDPTRSINNTIVYGTCDHSSIFNASSSGSWIRFIGAGGTIIPFTAPGINHCGAYTTTWYNGTLPVTVGAIENASICLSLEGFTCVASIPTSIVNCGGFYVYLLTPLKFCNARYCTN